MYQGLSECLRTVGSGGPRGKARCFSCSTLSPLVLPLTTTLIHGARAPPAAPHRARAGGGGRGVAPRDQPQGDCCVLRVGVGWPCPSSGFMSLREITGKRIIVTHLSNHTPGVIFTVHDISHLGVKCHEFVMSECMKSHASEISHSPSLYLLV